VFVKSNALLIIKLKIADREESQAIIMSVDSKVDGLRRGK
jgi:hypothetical protein